MSYPHLDQIRDPHARQAMRIIFDRIAAAERQANTTPVLVAPAAAVVGSGQRVVNVADPTDDADAVNKRTLRMLVISTVNAALRRVGFPAGITARI